MSVKEWEPKIIAFLCHWCSYAAADLAGVSRFSYPPNVRIIRVPCSSRVNPQFVLRAFAEGADGVLVAGCHPGDCHYVKGNYYARRRLWILQKLLEFVGMEPARFQVHWISGAEGAKFAETIKEMVEEVRVLGPNRLFQEVKDICVS
ncbi:methyl-viologen-reducing hydrogenase delta subunit [Ammonifex degensii KC4]|uniref:Methyl-viologen-reducing hydrogenase delta subunit n=1 Tax=Ammonifex degensii (strain DSM 10501 / KC4) TaxID=429009 RepID=C9R810_AMMDK|nr:hydrogenase iron-sulfur subunit [Ammonifex degensii]ACX52439.1 methyl-viologen-reducing hydrogenase delta subunit [Ammonifex degensii KC4]